MTKVARYRFYIGVVFLALVALVFGSILVLGDSSSTQTTILRLNFIALFTVLPAIMYYVFIATRKSSLFQEFVSNLNRMGLLQGFTRIGGGVEGKGVAEEEGEYFNRMRVLSYIKRFEGVYGPIDEQLIEELLSATNKQNNQGMIDTKFLSDQESSGSIFSLSTSIPIFIATILLGLGWLLILPPWEVVEASGDSMVDHVAEVLTPTRAATLFAYLGAYFFSLQMVFKRFVTHDLRANVYVSVSMRVSLSVIGAWILGILLDDSFFAFIGGASSVVDSVAPSAAGQSSKQYFLFILCFVVGAFPSVLWQLIRSATSRLTRIASLIPNMHSSLPLNKLDGLTVWHQARLEEEDIENIFNMANADIMDLFLSTKIPPERIMDWVDQAMLQASVGPRTKGESLQNELWALLDSLSIKNATGLEDVLSAFAVPGCEDNQPETEITLVPNSSEDHQRLKLLLVAVRSYHNLDLVRNWKGSVLGRC